MTKAKGSRSQKRMRMSLSNSSRSVGLKDFTTAIKDPPGWLKTVAGPPASGSVINHWKTTVAAPRAMQPSNANRTPCSQPNRVMSQPPISGPIIIGTRRTIDCTPTPIVCCRLSRDVATTLKVAGEEKALQAGKRKKPKKSASPRGQQNTTRGTPEEKAVNNKNERAAPP